MPVPPRVPRHRRRRYEFTRRLAACRGAIRRVSVAGLPARQLSGRRLPDGAVPAARIPPRCASRPRVADTPAVRRLVPATRVRTSRPGQRSARATGRKVAAGVLGVLLAVGGGVAGAAWMHELDGNNTTTTAAVGAGGAPDTAPIIDRSSLASIAAAVRPSVVSITTSNADGIRRDHLRRRLHPHQQPRRGDRATDPTSTSRSPTAQTVKGKLVGTDPKTDLAVFKAQDLTGAHAGKFGNSGALQVGDTVLAIGSPLGLDGSVTVRHRQRAQPHDRRVAATLSHRIRSVSRDSRTRTRRRAPRSPVRSRPTPRSTRATRVAPWSTRTVRSSASTPRSRRPASRRQHRRRLRDPGQPGQAASPQDIIKGVAVSAPVPRRRRGRPRTATVVREVQQVTSGSPADKPPAFKVGDVITAFNGQPVHTSDDLINDVQGGDVNDTGHADRPAQRLELAGQRDARRVEVGNAALLAPPPVTAGTRPTPRAGRCYAGSLVRSTAAPGRVRRRSASVPLRGAARVGPSTPPTLIRAGLRRQTPRRRSSRPYGAQTSIPPGAMARRGRRYASAEPAAPRG